MTKIWDLYSSWEEAETAWDMGAKRAAADSPLRTLKSLPQMPGITADTQRNLKWKSFRYMLFHKEGFKIFKSYCKHPLRYGLRYVRSLFKKKAYRREGDFFLYGFSTVESFKQAVKNPHSLILVGFSYCQKPLECPSGRFSDGCMRDPEHPTCRQCPIGKMLHALPRQRTIPLIIPTVHYIGDQVFKWTHAHPDKEILFLITACEMTLEMFSDWGNMVGIKGIGVRLDGRICNTMRAFELSEKGIKPGLTVLKKETERGMLNLIRSLREG